MVIFRARTMAKARNMFGSMAKVMANIRVMASSLSRVRIRVRVVVGVGLQLYLGLG
jgi:hypothetical protein